MTPVMCRVKHDPDNDSYGDCLRACIATVLDLTADEVPHFADHGRSSKAAFDFMRTWAGDHRLAPFIVAYPGEIALSDLLDMHATLNPASTYILFGGVADGGDHCVVCEGGHISFNPAWYGSRIVGPLSNGTWQVLVMGRM